MHGLVFKQLKGHVVDEHGRDAWTEVVEAVPEGRQAYLPVRAYPDGEFAALLEATADLDGGDRRATVRSVGERVGAALYDTYDSQIPDDWGYFDLLAGVETVAEAAREGGDADPPRLGVDREADDRVAFTYGSDRQLCDLGKGIAVGLADACGLEVAVEERACTREGAGECELVVSGA